jgi:hypothetical protein
MWALLFTVVSTIGLGALLTAFEVSRWDQRSATDIHNSIRCSTASPGSTSLSYRSASSAYWS